MAADIPRLRKELVLTRGALERAERQAERSEVCRAKIVVLDVCVRSCYAFDLAMPLIMSESARSV